MSAAGGDPAAAAAAIVAAVNERDPDRLRALLGHASEVVTGRSVHAGPDAVVAWAGKEYDHLRRVYAIDEYRQAGRRVLALGAVQYVWSEGGEVADSTPIALEIEVEGGVLGRLTVHDDVRAALAEFESGSR